MGYVVRMPQLGMTMEEGMVVEWTVDESESFEAGDVIAVVESEKTTNDIEAREDGVIRERFVELDQPLEPGDPIAYVGASDEEVPEGVREEVGTGEQVEPGAELETDAARSVEPGESVETAVTKVTEPVPATDSGSTAQVEHKVSPRARSYAAEQDVSAEMIERIDGTGPDGAVIERDVIEAVESGVGVTEPRAPRVAAAGRDIYEERTGSGVRRTVARRMTESAREAPQVTLNRRVPVDAMLEIKERLESDRDVHLSVTDFLVAAVVEALSQYPEFNAIYEERVHKLARNVNVGIAVDVEDGLLTPVIRGADRLTIEEISAERSRLVARALDGAFMMDDLTDGTFTITNLGTFGVESFDPLLNPPEVAILGVGAVESEFDPETETARRRIGLSLTFDHRAVDGADAARFLDAIADALAHPLRLVSDEKASSTFREKQSGTDEERTVRAKSTGGMRATVAARRFEWDVDEPEDVGGTDTAPNPVEQFLGSLSSCLALMVGNIAERRDVAAEGVEVTAHAEPSEGPIERIAVEVVVTSPDDEQKVKRVVQTADRACFVSRLVDDDVERSLDVTVRA